MFKRKSKGIGLALGGGAALGAAHIGIIRAIEEYQVPIRYISGTSIGAFVGALYAFGKTSEELTRIAHDMSWIQITGLTLSRLGLLKNDKLGSILSREIGDVSFKDSPVPLSMITTDISNGEKVVLNSGNVIQAMQASTCVPGVFSPVTINNRMLVDGGILENVPVSPLMEMGAGQIIAVDLIKKRTLAAPKNLVGILMNTFYLFLSQHPETLLRKTDCRIQPDLGEFSVIATKNIDKLIEAGYTAAVDKLRSFKF